MEEGLSGRLERRAGLPGLVEGLAGRLSGSELNSLLLEVYRRKAAGINPAALLMQYRRNRLVQPSSLDMIELLELELRVLRFMQEHGFQPLELSPAAQFGSCSAVATVDQHKVISALRGTEIVADATNALALHIAATIQENGQARESVSRLCTVHRHIRTQPQDISALREMRYFASQRISRTYTKGYHQHFKIGCMVTSGVDRGSYAFECASLLEQLRILVGLFSGMGVMRVVFRKRGGYAAGNPLIDRLFETLLPAMDGVEMTIEDQPAANDYYKGVQFKIYLDAGGRSWEMADGGFVDWTQRLLENRKERLLISGFGLEWMYKILHEKGPLSRP